MQGPTHVPVRRRLKQLLKSVSPTLAAKVDGWNYTYLSRRANRNSGSFEVNAKVVKRHGPAIVGGPFEGVVIPDFAFDTDFMAPILLGAYERFLHAAFFRIKQSAAPSMCLDIGARTGFMAVGMARWFPGVKSYAFDPDPWSQKCIARMAEINGVSDRVCLEGLCGYEWLQSNLKPRSLIVSDCEGGEAVVFRGMTPELSSATLVIETHEDKAAGITERLRSLFSPTHTIEVVDEVETDAYVEVGFLGEDAWKIRKDALRVHETSLPQQWLVCFPKA